MTYVNVAAVVALAQLVDEDRLVQPREGGEIIRRLLEHAPAVRHGWMDGWMDLRVGGRASE